MAGMEDRIALDDGAMGRDGGEPPVVSTTANILVVDDDPKTLYALEHILDSASVTIVTAKTGEDALKHVLQHDFALILMDVRMPGMDGYETAALIRNREKSRHIPIIFLTAVDKDDVHMFRGYTAGAVDYVFKPVEPLILKSKVNVFVELYRKSEEIRREEQAKRHLEAENFRVREEKMRAEHALWLAEERQSHMIDSLPLALYTADVAKGFKGPRFSGPAIERVTGFPGVWFDEAGRFWASRIHAADRDRVLGDLDQVASGADFATEYRWRCADGTYKTFFDRAVVMRDANGKPQEIFGTWLDVTEHRQLKSQLVQAQKMEAIGRLTGGIAHDFNNMLTAVMGNLDLLRRSLKPDGKAAKRAEIALQSAIRCSDLTQRLLYFARHRPTAPGAVATDAVVGGMMEILRRSVDDSIEIVVTAGKDTWPAIADLAQLESTLLNLVLNARDALPEGGKVIIETANVTLEEPYEDQNFHAPADHYVMLAVTDDGVGMPQEVLERVFEPFFTTKDPGGGTGLGLSMTYAFVQQVGGFIRIESEPGKGTTVRVYLKRAAEPATTTAAPTLEGDADAPRAKDGEIVLCVEDDAEVRRITADTLRDLGYEVIEAEHGPAALEMMAGSKVDLLFTDVAMPGGMTGRQLAREAQSRKPELRVLLTSGYADRIADESSSPGNGSAPRLLKKPYRDHELAHAVRQALDVPRHVAAANGG
jgi:signal transduction histidine kinase/response regulator RpfG family c-di-GMP phosphodiesterase